MVKWQALLKLGSITVSTEACVQVDLLRHGVTQAGQAYIGSSDSLLTDDGWHQMEQTLSKSQDWDLVVSSPLQRCRLFAESYAKQQGLELQVEPAFREYHFGIMEGKTAQQVIDQHPGVLEAFWQDPVNCAPPQAETLADFQTRILAGASNLLRQCAGKRVLLICHGGVIRALLCHLDRKPISQLLQYPAAHGTLHSVSLTDEALCLTETS